MPETPYSKFRLGEDTLADLDAIAASNGGVRAIALRESIAYWRHLVEEAGRRNADDLTREEWTLLGHAQVGADAEIDEIIEPRGVGQPPVQAPTARDWSHLIAAELVGTWDGREAILPLHRREKRACRTLARKVAKIGVVRGYALYAALRYFWQHPEAGIAACAAPEVWMTPTHRG